MRLRRFSPEHPLNIGAKPWSVVRLVLMNDNGIQTQSTLELSERLRRLALDVRINENGAADEVATLVAMCAVGLAIFDDARRRAAWRDALVVPIAAHRRFARPKAGAS